MAIPGGRLIRFSRRGAGEAELPGAAELLAALPIAILTIDGDGLVRDCNPPAEALLNLSRISVVGRTIEDMIGHPMTSLAPDQPIAAYDIDMVIPLGRPHRADLTVAPLPDRPGWRVILIHGRASHDLAARRGEQSSRGLPAAAAASLLAHEIKNPLSGIRGAAQLLESGAPPEQVELTGLIRGEVDRIARLIDRMEGLSDTRPRPLEALNIHSVLSHARDLASAGFAAERRIREQYDPSLPDVLGNRDALVQIVLNLLKNAAEATGEGGTITLTTAYRHGVSIASFGGGERLALPIELCVIDDGPGAPEAIADHLFDPFVTSKPSGSGIGLALVDKLVGEMGGIVEYAREGQPGRTVFRLLLPRAPVASRRELTS
ncbi:two-component system sensor histidine kinase NtrB [Sphingomonas abietis]|uniref:histidine kinase n=1 Tax=Sphingomonas abietis TaxID=3012344 RepID=A0ABY7NS93_9SPHN|nr:ATP-binding protein [Sphingomonas abietis]WBO24243.1 ATP-binding protein [Sphingomonas abietis]